MMPESKGKSSNYVKLGYPRSSNPIKEIQENNLNERASNRSIDEKFLDIALSGTSATLVIQTIKKIYIGWVGDSLAVVGKRDKKLTP
jgi:serine/threonine protein phosphatase PrpC